MTIIEKLKSDKKLLLIVIGFVIATFLIPYITIPGLVLWWFYKKSKFSKKVKVITTVSVCSLVVISGILMVVAYSRDIEPHLNVLEPASSTTVKVQQITIKGTYDPVDRKVWVNGKVVITSNGSFETTYQLREGENKIEVTAGDWKRAHVYLSITRELTEEEKVARVTSTPIPKSTTATTSTPKSTQTPTAIKPKEVSELGKEVFLRLLSTSDPEQIIPLSPTKELTEEVRKALRAKDMQGLLDLMLNEGVFAVPNGTKALLIDKAFALRKVRILQGEMQGKAGWLEMEFVVDQ